MRKITKTISIQRILLALLMIATIISLSSCGKKTNTQTNNLVISETENVALTENDTPATSTEANTAETNTYESTEEEKEEVIDMTTLLGGEIKHKMAKLGEAKINGKYVTALALELPPTISSDIHYSVTLLKNGNKAENSKNFSYSYYIGKAATEETMSELKKANELPDDLTSDACTQIYTFVLNTSEPIATKDYKVSVTRESILDNSISDKITFKANSEAKDINTSPAFAVGNVLIKVSDNYLLAVPTGNKVIGHNESMFGTSKKYEDHYFIDIFDSLKAEDLPQKITSSENTEENVEEMGELQCAWYDGFEQKQVSKGWTSFCNFEKNEYEKETRLMIGVEGPRKHRDDIITFVNSYRPAIVADGGIVIFN